MDGFCTLALLKLYVGDQENVGDAPAPVTLVVNVNREVIHESTGAIVTVGEAVTIIVYPAVLLHDAEVAFIVYTNVTGKPVSGGEKFTDCVVVSDRYIPGVQV